MGACIFDLTQSFALRAYFVYVSQLHEVVNLCFEGKHGQKHKAGYIRELLEDAWLTLGIWDTYL